jgi:hypothetical protein
MTAVATVPSTDITGLGTMSTQNANAVAITGGTINGTTIGATTPSSVNATTITGQTARVNGTGSNLLLYSEQLQQANWSTIATTVTANTQIAPDGTTTADTLVGSSGSSRVFQAISPFPTTSSTWTLSVYLKSASNVTARIGIGSAGIREILTQNVSVTTDWQRFSITATGLSTDTGNLQVSIYCSDGTSGNTIFAWGAQGERASSVGNYVATTTTAIYGTPTLSFSGVSTIGLQSDGSLFVQPAGTGALQAQATTSTTAGGNARGANAVDWQTSRSAAGQVASGIYGVIGGGVQNTASGAASSSLGGQTNSASATNAVIGGGQSNASSGINSAVVGGISNSATGYYGFVGNGYLNSTTANAAVTTQSGTMNATTAVTLSGSNASIKVGQYISGTSIANDTYVAAISGTSLTLSKVASGSSTSTLSFFTPHGVVVGGGNNQATGAYSAILGGGDAGTAANRNVASGDWSFVGGGRNNTASGNGSVICGGGVYAILSPSTFPNVASGNANFVGAGINNNASGDIAAIVGGQGNVASGSRAFVGAGIANTASGGSAAIMGGNYGITRGIEGNHVFPACNVPIASFQGVSQAALLVLGVQTTDATATVLRCNTSAASTSNQVILPNNSAYFFTGEVISGVTGGGNTKGWTIEGVIKRGANAASTALVGTPTVTSTYADAGASTWVIAVTADTTNGGLRVTFTGQAATTIRTVCQIRTTEMTY